VQTASSIVSSTLAAHSDLIGIFSTAAFNTEGAVAALKAKKDSGVTIVGFDANPPGVKQIQDGDVAAQVVLKPYDEGMMAAEQAINSLQGKTVEKKISTGAVVATKDNLAAPEVQKYLYSFTCPSS
jgi:ribose transport system substrate-binding protein